MSFKFINPGYYQLMDNYGGATNIVSATRSPYTGLGFYNTNRYMGKIIPADCEEVWVKVDAYGDYNLQFRIYVSSGDTGSLSGLYVNNETLKFWKNNTLHSSATWSREQNKFYPNWLVHVKFGTNGLMEISQDGKELLSYAGEIKKNTNLVEVQTATIYTDLSSIIISDEAIIPTERIILAPVASTESTMTDNGDGSYTATVAGENVLQTIDTAALQDSIGSGATITGVCLIADNALYEGGLNTIQSVFDGNPQETIALSTTAGRHGSSITYNGQVNTLNGKKFGWQTV